MSKNIIVPGLIASELGLSLMKYQQLKEQNEEKLKSLHERLTKTTNELAKLREKNEIVQISLEEHK